MLVVLVYAATLLLAVLLSQLFHRTVLSASVLFLVVGLLIGDTVFGLLPLAAAKASVAQVASYALFAVLFTDAMRVGAHELARAWHRPGRALLLGLPLTLAITAVLARTVAGLPWGEAFLVGAVLSPTDPVFAAALVGREEVPARLRFLLNVESGLNDGLALPIVVVLAARLTAQPPGVTVLLGELGLGVLLGVAIPATAVLLHRAPLFEAMPRYDALGAFALGLLVFAAASLLHANAYLAAFAAGVTVATLSVRLRRAFAGLGGEVTRLLELAALLLFGAVIGPATVGRVSAWGYLFALLALVVARPLALAIALFPSDLTWREWIAAAWFGPKGFASVVYGLLILASGARGAEDMFALVALVTAASIVAHSSTDVLVARWFTAAAAPGEEDRRETA